VNVVHLEVTYPDGRQESVVVDAERVLIGSGAHCDLRLPGEIAATEHAAVEILGETVSLEALASVPPLTLDGQVVSRAALKPGSVLALGKVEIRVTTSAVVGDAERVRAERRASGSQMVRLLGLGCLALLAGGLFLMSRPEQRGAPAVAPPLFSAEVSECPVKDPAQAAALAVDKRIVADGKRERHPFYLTEGVEAVQHYTQAAACFRVAGDVGLANELAAVAQHLRTEVIDDARARRLRLERALRTEDTEVGTREVVALRALFLGQQGPYVEWLNGVARKLNVDKETQ
jgi:hypothetical protein